MKRVVGERKSKLDATKKGVKSYGIVGTEGVTRTERKGYIRTSDNFRQDVELDLHVLRKNI